MFRCLYVDHDCLTLPKPDPLNNATCRYPTDPIKGVKDEQLNGLWYVVRGFNPMYDCFKCQKSTFEVKDGKVGYSAQYSMPAVNGTTIWPTAAMSGDDVTSPGSILFSGEENGLPEVQDWYIMLLTDDTIAFYYCGQILDQWHYEGLVVMSRTETMNPDREADL